MCWSFARDHGLPFSHIWSRVNPRVGVPVNAVWFMVTFAFLLGLPMLKSYVAFSAVVSISTIGLYISYAIPIFLRITVSRKQFVKGAFHLGFMSIPCGCHCCCMGVPDYGTLLQFMTMMQGSWVLSIPVVCITVSSPISTACCRYSSAGHLF